MSPGHVFEWSVSVPETPFISSAAGATFHIMEPMELRARSCWACAPKKPQIVPLQQGYFNATINVHKNCPKASLLGGFYGIAPFGKVNIAYRPLLSHIP